MKLTPLTLTSAFLMIGLTVAAHAQRSGVYQDPRKCVADMSALDVHGDGRISRDELTVACDSDRADALRPKG